MSVPASLKPVLPYLKRADELDRDTSNANSRVIAYYCRYYAMEQGLSLRNPENQQFLMDLMSTLESAKGSVPVTDGEAKGIITEFANSVFARADAEDQQGRASKGTARTFYAAGNFFDILQQFGDLDPDVEEKKKYAKFKASDILSAIKEGRTPVPGTGFEAAGEPTSANGDMTPVAFPTPAPATAPMPAPAPVPSPMPAPAPAPMPAPAPVVSAPQPAVLPAAATAPGAAAAVPMPLPTTAGLQPAPAASPATRAGARNAAAQDAIEYCAFAISALKHNETALAVSRLEAALQLLR